MIRTRRSVLLICLMAACAVLSVVAVEMEHVPIRPPVSLQVSSSAPRSQAVPASTALPLLEVPLSPEARSAPLYRMHPEQFPSEPRPRPNVNQEPLPLSPPGTYCHTAVLIQGKMYIYGGLASYEADKYMNDLWLYDFGASEFVQLQGNYVPPTPNHAGLSADGAAAFAPSDVPAMPNMATAPRHETSTSEKLHPDANPISPFLPQRRAQRPIRVMPLEHIFAKDADKPTAAGATVKELLGGKIPEYVPEFEREQAEQARRRAARLRAQLQEVEKELKLADAMPGAKSPAKTVFVETEEHLELHHNNRMRMLSRTIRAVEDARRRKNGDVSFPGTNSGTPYADVRHHRDGVASTYATDGRPVQDAAVQQHAPNTDTPTSAPANAREDRPHALQDFWVYDFDTHEWALTNVTSSQPLAHTPWLTPQQLNDPVFKDPLPILLPPTRRLHTSVVMKDRMIVFGGVSYNNLILGDIWIFNPEESSWIEASADGPGGSPILPREGHSAIVLKDELNMLVFGGVSYGFLPFNDLWKYSAVDNAWYRLSTPDDQTLPMQRWLHTAIYHEPTDSMVVFGGITAHYVPLNDVHVYDVASNTWRLQACQDTPPFPRMMHTAVTINDIMLISGGAANNLPMDDMFILDLKTWRWKELLQTGGYPFARTGATAIILSPAARSKEEGQLEDMSDDDHDPHLQWKVDQEKVAARPIVGSFSSEGIASNEEQPGNIRGLDAIAFPQNPVVSGGEEEPTTQRPIYRYRKHSQNDYYMVLFGGAAATSAPQDQTHLVASQEDSPFKPTGPLPATSFLELETSFSPEAAQEHKEGAIGPMRHKRTRATRIARRRRTKSNQLDSTSNRIVPREGGELDSFGPYDERREAAESQELSPDLAAGLDADRIKRIGAVRGVGLSRAPFCATFPWCHQTPPPPSMAELPPPENPEIAKREMARLDPMKNLPIKLDDLKKDPDRFGIVFQNIYESNHHNDPLRNSNSQKDEQ